LKAKFPFGKKPKGEDDESEEIEEEAAESSREDRTDATDISEVEEEAQEDDEPQSKSLVYKLKKKIQSLQKKNVKLAANASVEDDVEEGVVDSEAAKKKKKSKMLQIAIGGGLVLFLLSDYIIPTEEPAVVPVLKKRPKPIKKVIPVDGATTETPATDVKTETPTTETTPDSPVTVTSETPTDVPIEATPTDTTVTETPTDTTTTDTTVTEPVTTDTTIDATPTDTTVVEEPTSTTTDTVVTEPSTDTAVSVDSVDGGETKTSGDDSITDQILQDLEKQAKDTQPVEQKKQYVSPPDYEYRGRGLVYNCQGKHWACVDAPSFKTCEDNSSSVKYLKKKTECYPFNVYETPKGCESMQNRMVSSSAKTAFCAD
jgi:hypothetical protein